MDISGRYRILYKGFFLEIVSYLTGSDETVQTMETFLPLGTVRYIDVGDNSGSHANSAKLRIRIIL